MCRHASTRDRVLAYISQYTEHNGIAPTLREIAHGIGLTSPGSVHYHITSLRKAGLLKDYKPRKSRSVIVSNGIPRKGCDEKHICLKTNTGDTIILNMAANDGVIQFEGPYCLRGTHPASGEIIACSELDEEEYSASIVC